MAAIFASSSRMVMRAPAAPFSSRSSAFVAAPVASCRVAAVSSRATVVEVEAKLKTRKAASKRYKVTANGKVMSRRAGKQHLNEKMAKDTKRNLGKMVVISSANINNAIKCMPNSGIGN